MWSHLQISEVLHQTQFLWNGLQVIQGYFCVLEYAHKNPSHFTYCINNKMCNN